MKYDIKRFLVLTISLLALAIPAKAQQLMVLTSLSANTTSNILSASAIIDNLTLINTTTNNAQVNFYDSSNTTTTRVQAAYTAYSSYSTNFSVVWTNEANVLVTNTFSGLYTGPTAVSASTNTLPLVISLFVPASTILNKDVRLHTIRGLNATASQALTLTTTYRNP